jgi:MerR family transcriptional regulator, light-induced transcriptional regulator
MPIATVSTLKMQDAAALLNVSPSALRSWERRFGYPAPLRSAGGHRMYPREEIMALRDALADGLPISAAVGRAREALGSPSSGLARALATLDFTRADEAMEAALALGTVERAIEEVLLGAFVELRSRVAPGSAPWSLAARWAVDWLRRARRLCPAPAGVVSVLVGDATCEYDEHGIARHALELICARGGALVTTLPVTAAEGLADVVRRDGIDVMVLAGAHAEDRDALAWLQAARRLLGQRPLALYRRDGGPLDRALPDAEKLPDSPMAAAGRLLARLGEGGSG